MPVVLVRGFYGLVVAPPITTPTAIILRDGNGVRWAVSIMVAGNLDSEVTPTGPTTVLDITPLVMKDANGILWRITISITGELITTVVASASTSYQTIALLDDNSSVRTLTITTTGILVTT